MIMVYVLNTVFYLVYICYLWFIVFMHVYIAIVVMLYAAYHDSVHYTFTTGQNYDTRSTLVNDLYLEG